MGIDTNAAFVDALRQARLLESDQLGELGRILPRCPDPRALAKHLIQLGWLTPFQVNQVLQGQAAGLVLGQYRLLERIGEGGMGQVFKARHQAMGRIVALKVIRKDRLANAEAVKRFRREMQAAGQLSHPNVVTAFDADAAAGHHYFAMEFVDGIDLSALVKQQAVIPVALACECIRQAALGLAHAHEKGMVHRDIKPGNLLMTWTADPVSQGIAARPGVAAVSTKRGKPVLKILDMGLARLAPEFQDDGGTMLSQAGSVIGTPDFMAPEQAKNSSKVDARADIYGLGCTFYYVLTRQPPFPGGTNIEKLLKHQMDMPAPVEKVRPDVPEGVRAILRRMLAKRPEDRIQTAAEVALLLAPFCGGAAPATLPFPMPERSAAPTVAFAVEPIVTPVTPTMPAARGRAPGNASPGRLRRSFAGLGRSRRRLAIVAGLAGLVLLLGFFLLRSGAGSGSAERTSLAQNSSKGPSFTPKVTATERKQPPPDAMSRYLFPEAALLVVVNCSQIAKSEIYRARQEDIQGILNGLGLDTDRFADGMLLQTDRAILAMSAEDSPRRMLVLQGSFDTKRLTDFVGRGGSVRTVREGKFGDYYIHQDRARKEEPWAFALVGPDTFVMSPFPGLVAQSLRRGPGTEVRSLRDAELRNALERVDGKTSITVLLGGQVPMPSDGGRKGTLAEHVFTKLVTVNIVIANDVQVDLRFTPTSPERLNEVETFVNQIKQNISDGSKDLADLLQATFPEKPFRAKDSTILLRGRLTGKQLEKLFALITKPLD